MPGATRQAPAGAYAELLPGTTIDLTVTAFGVPSPVWTATDRSLLSNQVYTVFVLGAPESASTVFRAKNRLSKMSWRGLPPKKVRALTRPR